MCTRRSSSPKGSQAKPRSASHSWHLSVSHSVCQFYASLGNRSGVLPGCRIEYYGDDIQSLIGQFQRATSESNNILTWLQNLQGTASIAQACPTMRNRPLPGPGTRLLTDTCELMIPPTWAGKQRHTHTAARIAGHRKHCTGVRGAAAPPWRAAGRHHCRHGEAAV